MTIKEIEEASGMQRANIRFYESEGFLHPEREKNGYRNYTEKDLEILKKIKLLRSLHISLEEIKAMHNGEQDLAKTLEEHIVRLIKQQEELGKSQYVCEKMKKDGATYEKLNTEQYLLVLKNCRPEITEREEWVERDVPKPLKAPFLRIFARLFDYLMYMLLWMLLVYAWKTAFRPEVTTLLIGAFLCFVAWCPLALLLEPLFLCWFGATPGKLILGLYITYDLAEDMPLEVARRRTWRAVGMLHDWEYQDIFQLARIFECLDKGKTLDWDYEANTTIGLKDEKSWRRVVFLVCMVILVVGILGLFKFILVV